MKVREAVGASLGLLSRRDRRLLNLSVAIQMATSLLDLAGVLLLGLVGALSVTVVQSQPPPSLVTTIAEAMNLGDLSGQQLVIVFASAAALVLLTKSLVSSILTRRVFIFLANRQALVSARLSKELLSRPLTFLQRRSSQETSFALIQGVSAATIMILGQTVVALSEVSLLVILAVALVFLDPLVTIGAILFFTLVGVVLQKALGGWAARLGSKQARADIESLNTVQEATSAYREITVADRRSFYVDRFGKLRWEAARVAADRTFIGMLPKYMFEAALVIGSFLLAAILFATQNSVAAVGTLALFLAAGSRVMPSLLRLQVAALGLRGAAGVAESTFELADDLGKPLDAPGVAPGGDVVMETLRSGHADFQATLVLEDVWFRYPGSERPAVRNISLHLERGQSLGLVGRSGSGKSTLADLILGVLEPSSGFAGIGGVRSSEALRRWPGGVAYVPQQVVLANDTIRRNVALGLPDSAIDDDFVMDALRRAHLDEYVNSISKGMDAEIGEDGLRLSGGQRQRLGLARALYTRPKLLVLDEATSALDVETESAITKAISDLEGEVTTVVIAHRLSTVRDVDVLLYLEDGASMAQGAFDEVRAAVPALQRQAMLLGL